MDDGGDVFCLQLGDDKHKGSDMCSYTEDRAVTVHKYIHFKGFNLVVLISSISDILSVIQTVSLCSDSLLRR